MNRKGFTLIELMIVAVICGILTAIFIPSFKDAIRRDREKAKAKATQKVEVVRDITKTHNIYITNTTVRTITKYVTITNFVDVLKDDATQSKYETMDFRLSE